MLPNPLEEIARKLDEYNKRLSHLERLEGGGGLVLIEDIILTAPAVSITASVLSQIYDHLLLYIEARTDFNAPADWVMVQFNGDTGNNYDSVGSLVSHNAALATVQSIAGANGYFTIGAAVTTPANIFASFTVTLHNYSKTDRNKMWRGDGGLTELQSAGRVRIRSTTGQRRSTAAINQIKIFPDAGTNLIAGSRMMIYGL